MRNIIIEKVSREISKGVATEAQAVYILAEIRKILKDHDDDFSSYPILSFFCDWSLHAKMDHKIARSMLNGVEDFYRGLDSYLHIRKTSSFFPFVMLIVFRRELRLFFERNSLPLDLLNNAQKWERFLFLVLDIIIDCPLVSNSGYVRECKFIEYSSRDKIICELKLQDGKPQVFTSKSKRDFIEQV